MAFLAFFAVAFFAAFFCASSVLADYVITPETDLSANWTITNSNGITLDGNVMSTAKHTGSLTISSDPKITLSNGAIFEQSGTITPNKKAVVVYGDGTFKITAPNTNINGSNSLYGIYLHDKAIVDTSVTGWGEMRLIGDDGSIRFYQNSEAELIIGRNTYIRNNTSVIVYSGAKAKISQSTMTGINSNTGYNLTQFNVEFEVGQNSTLDSTVRIFDEGTGGGITKSGVGTMTILNSNNTYQKATTISAGKLVLSGAGNLTATSGVAISSGATLEFKDNDADGSGGALTFNRNISGAGKLVKSGTGTVNLTVSNSHTGGTTISGGTLKLTGAGTLGTGDVTLVTNEETNMNGTLEFNNSTVSLPPNISGSGDILVSSGTANLTGVVNQTGGNTTLADGTTLNIGNESTVVNATLNNLAVVDEDSSATLNITGNLTLNNSELTKFIGSITAPIVEKTGLDTLQLCFDAENAVSIGSLVVSSGRVDLKGYMTGGITVDANGVFSPGNSVGEAKFGGGYELYDGAKLLIEMDETGIDSLFASSFIENGGGIIELVIDGIPFGSQYDVITATNGFSGTQDEAYWLGKFGTLPDYMTLSVVDGVYGANSQTVRFSIDRNAVPEPSTWALLLLGAAGLLYVRKRKN